MCDSRKKGSDTECRESGLSCMIAIQIALSRPTVKMSALPATGLVPVEGTFANYLRGTKICSVERSW